MLPGDLGAEFSTVWKATFGNPVQTVKVWVWKYMWPYVFFHWSRRWGEVAAESDLYVITEWVKQGLTPDGVFLPRWPFAHHIPVTPQLCSAFSSCPRPFPAGRSPKRSFFLKKCPGEHPGQHQTSSNGNNSSFLHILCIDISVPPIIFFPLPSYQLSYLNLSIP